jgi:hypothetical protein
MVSVDIACRRAKRIVFTAKSSKAADTIARQQDLAIVDLSPALLAQIGDNMATLTYEKQITAHLVIDPYNDFISEEGKFWNRLKAIERRTVVCLICCGF